MKFQLVLQFPGSSVQEFDKLVDLENEMARRLNGLGDVDGHDFGSQEMNIFIMTDEPIKAFEITKNIPELNQLLGKMRAAYRAVDNDMYTFVWPERATGDFLIK